MPDCRPCLEDRLEATPAMYVMNGVPMCQACRTKRMEQVATPGGPPVPPVKAAQAGYEVFDKTKTVTTKKVEETTMSKDIDWDDVKRRRDAGTPVSQLAKELGCTATNVYQHMKGRRSVVASKQHVVRPAAANANGTGGKYADVIADLTTKRDALTKTIELLSTF